MLTVALGLDSPDQTFVVPERRGQSLSLVVATCSDSHPTAIPYRLTWTTQDRSQGTTYRRPQTSCPLPVHQTHFDGC